MTPLETYALLMTIAAVSLGIQCLRLGYQRNGWRNAAERLLRASEIEDALTAMRATHKPVPKRTADTTCAEYRVETNEL